MQGLLFSVLLLFALSAQGTEEWFSTERHGGCISLATIAWEALYLCQKSEPLNGYGIITSFSEDSTCRA